MERAAHSAGGSVVIGLALVTLALGLLLLPGSVQAAARVRALRPSASGGDPARRPRARRRRRTAGRAADALVVAAGWDLLAACLRAGLPVAEALHAVAVGMPAAVREALRGTGDLLALGAGPEEAWRPVLECPQSAPLAAAARRSARSGTALAGVAADLAARMRAEQADAAEAHAQRAGVLITGPLGLCFLPGFLCLGVVPVVIGLAGQLTVLR